MWRLNMTSTAKEWTDAGSFDAVAAAACRIREIEGHPVKGVFFEIHVDPEHSTDEEALGHLEHTGRRALHVVKRRRN